MVEKCRQVLDQRDYAWILLTDFSKVFDCVNHELLIAKLHVYGFSLESLKFIKGIYLSESRGLKSTLPSVAIVMLNLPSRRGEHLDLWT